MSQQMMRCRCSANPGAEVESGALVAGSCDSGTSNFNVGFLMGQDSLFGFATD